jgi:hypothetical protein
MDEGLTSPKRMRYFLGQLLGEDDFLAEQDYLMGKDRRHERFLHGWGVVCGLGVSAGARGTVTVEPGLAIDRWGREVVVSEPREVDPRVLTDDSGEPTGARPEHDAVTLCLAYAEDPSDPVPVPDETEDEIRFTRITESHRLLVRDGVPSRPPRLLSKEQRDAVLFGRETPAKRLGTASPEAAGCTAPDGGCVVLATVSLGGEDGARVDPWTYRRQLYSVVALQELLFRLARRVSLLEEAAGT